jgi:hypothetical protein
MFCVANVTGKVILFVHQIIHPKLLVYFESLNVGCAKETQEIILVM